MIKRETLLPFKNIVSFISKNTNDAYRYCVNHKTYTSILFLMTVGIFVLGLFSEKENAADSFVVKPTSLSQVVAVSGNVQSSKDATLSFQTSGQVSFVGVKVGDTVTQGQVLATLEAGNAQAALLEAESLLANRQATLLQLQEGSRKEEVLVKEQIAENAKNNLSLAYASLSDVIKNTDSVTTDIVKSKFASLFTFNGTSFNLSFASCDQRLQASIETKRTTLEDELASFQKKSSAVSLVSSEETLDSAFSSAYSSANLTYEIVNEISQLLLSTCSVSNTSLDSYRTTLSTVKTNMNTLFADITAKRNTLTSAKNSYAQALRDLELLKAGTNPYVLKAQMATVAQAEAQVLQAKVNLQKTVIRAPFNGVISEVKPTQGESFSANTGAISMLAEDGYEIEARIPEIDIVKVKTGAKVNVTLDAYGDGVIFPALVSRINPKATTEGTVPIYKAMITFVGKDSRIKQGMTANVAIVTEEKSNVIAVPARFVTIVQGDEGTVTRVSGKKEETVKVVLGVRGEKGLIEIREGVLVGDVLLPPKTTVRGAQKNTTK